MYNRSGVFVMAGGRIFLLMGKSTSGKDTVYKNLIADNNKADKVERN